MEWFWHWLEEQFHPTERLHDERIHKTTTGNETETTKGPAA